MTSVMTFIKQESRTKRKISNHRNNKKTAILFQFSDLMCSSVFLVYIYIYTDVYLKHWTVFLYMFSLYHFVGERMEEIHIWWDELDTEMFEMDNAIYNLEYESS